MLLSLGGVSRRKDFFLNLARLERRLSSLINLAIGMRLKVNRLMVRYLPMPSYPLLFILHC